jgi:parallel beta-helix repeat protein
VGKNLLPDGVQVAGNSFTNSGLPLRVNSIANLTISDGSVAGTDIDLTDALGNHTINTASTALWLSNADNVTVANLDVSWANSVGGSRSGTGIYVENGSDTVTIRDNLVRNRLTGIYVGGGSDVRVLRNNLTNSGQDANSPALYLSTVGKVALPDGVEVADNTFTNSGLALRVNSTPNLTISDGSVAGTDIDVTDAAGNHTMTSAGTALWLNNADNVTVANLDVSWANSVGGSRSGTGIYLENGNDNVTIRDSQARNRFTGIYVNGGTDVRCSTTTWATRARIKATSRCC